MQKAFFRLELLLHVCRLLLHVCRLLLLLLYVAQRTFIREI